MPGYYSRPMTAQTPLTPPDSGSGYNYRSMHYPQDPYVPHQNMGQPRHDSTYEFQQGYMQPAVAPAPPTYQYQQGSYQPTTSLPPIQSYYEPAGAPILPPLRINERAPFADGYQRRIQHEQQSAIAHEQQHRHAQKEEKATGGVSAKLDYDMERMTDFVTEATQSMYAFHNSSVCLADIDLTQSFQQCMQSPPSFRKWVHQVLSATRLPSATILLSLHYLNDRVANFPDSITPGENQIYRMLAVALILGSKFLDDNTFINRSWSDVTAINVLELNHLEMKWLHLIKYQLHIDPKMVNGLQAWIDAWKKYDSEYVAKRPVRLSPLDTNVHRHTVTRDRFSPYPTPYSATARSYDTPLSSRPSHAQYQSTSLNSADPWSAAERAPLDDYYKRQPHYAPLNDTEETSRRASEDRARQTTYAYPQSAHPSYYPAPSYASTWDQQAWAGAHRYDCNCSSCAYHFRPYSMNSSYAAQTVMG